MDLTNSGHENEHKYLYTENHERTGSTPAIL
jgi:hypothetical protein